MKRYLVFTFLIAGLTLFNACSKKDDDLTTPIIGLGGVRYQKTALDTELYEKFTKPYNIEVIYRWDAGLMGYTSVLVPAEENRVLPVMNILMKGWIEPFKEVAGELFVKKYIPKQYVLIGSYAYTSSGNIVLGSADQGLKVNIFGVNQINLKSEGGIGQVLGTVHHELAHVLHQNIMYPVDFELVCAGDYDSNGLSKTQAYARSFGFITGYGMTSPNEDFATLVATMLSNSKQEFDNIINSIPEEVGRDRLRKKENIVVAYFLQAWNIDFWELQRKTAEARTALMN